MSPRDLEVARETVRPRSRCPHCHPELVTQGEVDSVSQIDPEGMYLVEWPSGSRLLLFGRRLIAFPAGAAAKITELEPVTSPGISGAAGADSKLAR